MSIIRNTVMKNSRREFLAGSAAAAAGIVAISIGGSVDQALGAATGKKPGTCVLCFKCGQIKGSDLCCKKGAKKCSKCGLHKGSPGCCRLDGAKKPVCLCTYCGEIKGSAKCCKAGVACCSKCGLHKGSPGCCRITKETKPACATAMIGACGLACKACPVMKAGKCKGCASGKEASAAMIEKKGCKVLKCAAGKKIDYCGDCKMFTKCKKIIGKPYAQVFVDMQAKKL
jgi:hypothetical protein